MNHPLIIGAGGVASYLLPVLLKAFKPEKLTIIDKDILEEKNLDRQMFDEADIGQNKAKALIRRCSADWNKTTFNVIEDWFQETTVLPDDIDAIVCVADNHMARRAACELAERLMVRCYIGGNEYFDSQAYYYVGEWKGTQRDPRKRYPSIATSEEGSPLRCTGEIQESSPQLAIANDACASKLLHLMWLYEIWFLEHRDELNQQALDMLPYELNSSLMSIETLHG